MQETGEEMPSANPVVRPLDTGDFAWTIEVPAGRDPAALAAQLRVILDEITSDSRSGPGQVVQLWLPEVNNSDDTAVVSLGFEPYRDLWQLRVSLPLTAETDLVTRAYVDSDATDLIAVNNRAFAWHPEQGGMTAADLERQQREDWFDPTGVRIHEIDGTMAGFNWLKVHQPGPDTDFTEPMGEIYVIAVDPEFHGMGLGTKLSIAGLAHLHAAGLTQAMLYVESDNVAANRVYDRIGFHHHQTNRAYRLDPTP